ncbi:portal protein [Ruegeria lacuscaerulensis]|uniref:portal protein n=1 Tax=Ruegeria lacuscaerulensis TaxID=55218 RepID=UPI00147F034F|nr:portal protein [Ruegeria lacuscaerulensis]
MDEFDKRYAAAKEMRSDRVEEDGYEVYKFCFNGREDEWVGKRGANREPAEIFADVVANVAEDFYGDLFHTMTPENEPWVGFQPGVAIPEEDVDSVKEQIEAREKKLEKSIQASNYYDEGPTAFQDAVFGTVALWADRPSLSSPIVFEAVPCSEIYLILGPNGIEDRFRRKKYYYRDLKVLFPDANFPKKLEDKIKNASQTAKAEVIRGFWRDYSDPGNPVWRQEIKIDKQSVGLAKELGPDGSCPLIVGRFNAVPNSPWGRGPARRMLPTLRVLDELTRMNLENMDHTLDPAIVYPHDGILDLSDGLEAGIAYPKAPGNGNDIERIGGGDLDYGFFTEERIEERVRDGFYRDFQQRGKTPPSASQYMGEEQKQIRRMARPSGKLWKELGVGVLKRVEWLETQSGGSLEGEKPITINGNAVTIRPISPLERAQAREKVLVAQQIMGIAQENLGPEQAGLMIDGPATIENIKEVMKDKIVKVRSQEQIMQIAQAMQAQGAPSEPRG